MNYQSWTSWASSERLIYVPFESCVQEVYKINSRKYDTKFTPTMLMLFKLVPGASFRYKWKARKRTIIFLILLCGRDRMLFLFFFCCFIFPSRVNCQLTCYKNNIFYTFLQDNATLICIFQIFLYVGKKCLKYNSPSFGKSLAFLKK